MKRLHQRLRAYFGGMSPLVPFAFVATVMVVVALGERAGNTFLFVATLAVAGIVGYALYVVKWSSGSLGGSDLIPFVSGLVAALVAGAVGLGTGGFGESWGNSSLALAVVVAAAVIVTVRTLRATRSAST